MSVCSDCYFHSSGYLWNACSYFEVECYREIKDECAAFSTDGNLPPQVEEAIYEETNGTFGKKANEVAI